MNTPRANSNPEGQPPTQMRFMFSAMTWLFIGPVGMALTLISIAQRGTGWATGHDALFFAFLMAALAARWIDHAHGDPVTNAGQGAPPGAARKYTLLVASIGGAAWAIANLFGNHLLQ